MNKFVILATVLFSSGLSIAQEQFTLEQAQKYALEHNIQMKLTAKDVAAAREDVKQVLGVAYPQISAEANFQNFIDIPVQLAPADAFAFPDWMNQTLAASAQQLGIAIPPPSATDEFSEFQFGTKFNANGGITVNQVLFDGAVYTGVKAAKSYAELMDLTVVKTEKEIKDAVATSYYAALVANENNSLLDNNLSNLEQIVKESKAYNKEGFLDDLQIEQLEFNLENLKSQKESAAKQRDLAYALLKFQMGYDINKEIILNDQLDKMLEVKTNIEKSTGLQNHINYQLLDKQEYLLGLNLKVEKTNNYPKLYGFLNHQQNAFQNDLGKLGDQWFPTTLWGLKAQLPIFSGFRQRANIAKNKIEIEKVQLQKELTLQGLALEEKQARTEQTVALDQLNQQKKSLALAQKIKDKTDIKFKEGLSSSTELTQAQNQYLAAQGAYLNAVFQLLNAKIKLNSILN